MTDFWLEMVPFCLAPSAFPRLNGGLASQRKETEICLRVNPFIREREELIAVAAASLMLTKRPCYSEPSKRLNLKKKKKMQRNLAVMN